VSVGEDVTVVVDDEACARGGAGGLLGLDEDDTFGVALVDLVHGQALAVAVVCGTGQRDRAAVGGGLVTGINPAGLDRDQPRDRDDEPAGDSRRERR
jgi:hypothetical protein